MRINMLRVSRRLSFACLHRRTGFFEVATPAIIQVHPSSQMRIASIMSASPQARWLLMSEICLVVTLSCCSYHVTPLSSRSVLLFTVLAPAGNARGLTCTQVNIGAIIPWQLARGDAAGNMVALFFPLSPNEHSMPPTPPYLSRDFRESSPSRGGSHEHSSHNCFEPGSGLSNSLSSNDRLCTSLAHQADVPDPRFSFAGFLFDVKGKCRY